MAIICSCNELSTMAIKEVIAKQENPTPKTVLNELGWSSECATCVDMMVGEVKKLIGETNDTREKMGVEAGPSR